MDSWNGIRFDFTDTQSRWALGWLCEIMDHDMLEQIAFTQLRIKKSIKQSTLLCHVPLPSTHIASTNVTSLYVESHTAIAHIVIMISLFHLHVPLLLHPIPLHTQSIFSHWTKSQIIQSLIIAVTVCANIHATVRVHTPESFASVP
jgi:hypothetical protein